MGSHRYGFGSLELDPAMGILLRDGAPVASPGTVVVLPPNVRHAWKNISDEPGQMFGIVTPGGCEHMFIDIETSGADTPRKIAAIEARYGIENDETVALAKETWRAAD